MAQILAESISKTLRLPRPHLHEENRSFTLIEDWSLIVELVASQPIHVKPLGYYRTPDDVDIYVFECSLGKSDGDKKTWKIYRRYSHFQRYVAHSSELLSSMVVPRLSQAYMKIFSAKSCKDRLVELHAWLLGVVENTQTYCAQKTVFQEAASERGIDSQEAVPAMILASFLFAGANLPFPHVFRGMPSFAFAMEEMNIQLTKAAPVYPSKLRSSLETSAGLGLRLTASHEQEGKYIGAMVGGFLRDVSELDKNLALLNIGSKLVRINGVDVADEAFDKVLAHLRSAGMPLRLRFVYNPQVQRRPRGQSVYLRPNPEPRSRRMSSAAVSEKHTPSKRRESMATTYRGSVDMFPSEMTPPSALSRNSVTMRPSFAQPQPPNAQLARAPSSSASSADPSAQKRFYSVDSRRSTATTTSTVGGLFGSVFSDLFGRRRGETVDNTLLDSHVEEIFSWDDVGGEFQDLISRGFFTFLSQSMLYELRMRRTALTGALDDDDAPPDEKEWKRLDQRKGQGIWSTPTGPLGWAFGACKLRDVEAAMLEIAPVFFSSRAGHVGSEKRLTKGFVLVSVNNESTFGLPFAEVMKMLTKASRPTSVCFRWFKDYSPFLETELAEQDPSVDSSRRRGGGASNPTGLRHDPSKTFESGLDCVSEAQADLCSNLHLALVENATIRNEIGTLQDGNRERRQQQEQQASDKAKLETQLQDQRDRISQLLEELADSKREHTQTKQQLRVCHEQLGHSKMEQQKLLEKAHANAIQKIAEHEERLVKESNKSIENARMLAERKMQKELDAALDDMQRRHEEYLQKLAEEHSEETESLSQQVAVWRHQVEVLTEAEKRNYASMINQGTNPYDFQRSRFGMAESPYSSSGSSRTFRTSEKNYVSGAAAAAIGGGGGGGGGAYPTNGFHAAPSSMRGIVGRPPNNNTGTTHLLHHTNNHNYNNNQKDDESTGSPNWHDGTTSPAGFKDHGSSEFSDRSSVSNNTTNGNNGIWGRVVSLIG